MKDRASQLIASALFLIAGAILVHAGITTRSVDADDCRGWGIAIMIAAGAGAIWATGIVDGIREANRKFDASNKEE